MSRNSVYLLLVLFFSFFISNDAFARKKENEIKSYLKMANTFYKNKKYLQAAEYFEKVISMNTDPKYYFNIAQSYRLGGELEKALQYYKLFLPYVRSLKTISKKRKTILENEITGYIVELTDKIEKLKQEKEKEKKDKEDKEKKEKQLALQKQQIEIKRLEEEKRKLQSLKNQTVHNTVVIHQKEKPETVTSKWWFKGGLSLTGTLFVLTGVSGFMALNYNTKYADNGIKSDKDRALLYRTVTDIFLSAAIISGAVLGVKIFLFNDTKEKSTSQINAFPFCTGNGCGALVSFDF